MEQKLFKLYMECINELKNIDAQNAVVVYMCQVWKGFKIRNLTYHIL